MYPEKPHILTLTLISSPFFSDHCVKLYRWMCITFQMPLVHNNVTLYRLLKQVKCYITSFQGKHHYMQYRATHVLFIHIINQTLYKSLSFPAETRLSWQVNVQSCIGTSSESPWPTETIKNTTYSYITVLSFVEYRLKLKTSYHAYIQFVLSFECYRWYHIEMMRIPSMLICTLT